MATKYKKVKWNPAHIRRMYRAGKNVSQIAQAIGYPPNTGNNRVRNVLKKSRVAQARKERGKA